MTAVSSDRFCAGTQGRAVVAPWQAVFLLLALMVLLFASRHLEAAALTIPPKSLSHSDEAALQRSSHLEHLGFYASAMGHWNFTDELAPFTTLTWVHVGTRNALAEGMDSMLERMDEARDAGVQVVLSLEQYLFADAAGTPLEATELSDFLNELRARLVQRDLLSTLVMIYPKDEPFREFLKNRDPGFIEQYISGEVYEDIHADLLFVNDAIKQVFPEKPIGVILSGYEMDHEFFSIPDNFDWIGFNCYTSLFAGCADQTFVEDYSRLMAYMQPHQRLMAVPEAWVTNEKSSDPFWPEVLRQRLLHHYEMALAEPLFVAFIPFIWSFDAPESTPGIGVREMVDQFSGSLAEPSLLFRETLEEIGLDIKRGQPQYPNLAWAELEAHAAKPAESHQAGIIRVSEQGMVEAFAFNDALRHKNLRYQLLVRDRRGALLYKSRMQRTNHRDDASRFVIGVNFLGTPGIRQKLPQWLSNAYGGMSLQLQLRVFADGSSLRLIAQEQLGFTAGSGQGDQPVLPPGVNPDALPADLRKRQSPR